MKRSILAAIVFATAAGLVLLDRLGAGRGLWYPYWVAIAGGRTHEQVLGRLRAERRPALRSAVQAAGIAYPPPRLCLVGLKSERMLEVWAPGAPKWRRLRSYPILALSGGPGPKLREGDRQVPEGIYRLTTFNPNSSYHLSLRVDYPNADDRAAARADRRTRLGGDIYIHGKAVSIGCLAIGDDAIEELYLLLAEAGLGHVKLLLAPSADPRPAPAAASFVPALYERLRAELRAVRGGPS